MSKRSLLTSAEVLRSYGARSTRRRRNFLPSMPSGVLKIWRWALVVRRLAPGMDQFGLIASEQSALRGREEYPSRPNYGFLAHRREPK